jgi:hypothetical protein
MRTVQAFTGLAACLFLAAVGGASGLVLFLLFFVTAISAALLGRWLRRRHVRVRFVTGSLVAVAVGGVVLLFGPTAVKGFDYVTAIPQPVWVAMQMLWGFALVLTITLIGPRRRKQGSAQPPPRPRVA